MCQDPAQNRTLGRLSRSLYVEGTQAVSSAQPSIADDASLEDAFYGAPAVIHGFTPVGWEYTAFDAATAAAHMALAAWSLGVGSCFVSRAAQTFATPEGAAFRERAGVPAGCKGAFHLCLGYPAADDWSPKLLRTERLLWC